MTFLFGRRYALLNIFLRIQHKTETLCVYCSDCTIPFSNGEIKNLLSKENRERCLKKLYQSAPVETRFKQSRSKRKLAAVLIALCTEGENMDNLSILYTRRSHLLSRHMRQVSFPGGMKEDNEDFIECALRETQEEIGLPHSRIEIWGSGSLITPPNTAAIMPVIGVIKNLRNELKLNRAEVEEVYTIPLKQLASPQALHYTQFKGGFSLPVYIVNGIRIWGITGLITNIFLNCFLTPKLHKFHNRVKFITSFKCNPA